MRSNPLLLLSAPLALGLVITGCSKQDDSTATAKAAAENATQAAAPAAGAAQATATTEANAQVQDLQLQVEAYEKIYKRKPASLEQMVKEGFLPSLPPAPPGKRYSLDPATGRVSVAPR